VGNRKEVVGFMAGGRAPKRCGAAGKRPRERLAIDQRDRRPVDAGGARFAQPTLRLPLI
jgi:hypothetical protein